jgi:hypothetical protein
MKVSREVYYCTFTDDNGKLPKFSPPFTTESGARREAKKLSPQGYWGAIEKHCEFKQDYESDYAWHVDWEGYGDAIEIIDYFLIRL